MSDGASRWSDSQDDRTRSRLYANILDKIIAGEFPPGMRLVEDRLAEAFGISRTPVREVLFALEQDGLVERLRHRGARVVTFTPHDVEEIYETRIALERLAVRKATWSLPVTQLLDFERRLELLNRAEGRQIGQEQARLDLELHRFIVSHSGNRRLAAYLDNISNLIHALRLIGYQDEANARRAGEEHLGIVRALMFREADLAESLLVAHLNTSKKNALEAFLGVNNGQRAGEGPTSNV